MINYIKKEVKKHAFDYLILLIASIFFILALNLFRGERFLEFVILLAFVSFYVVWGVYHHAMNDHLSIKIVLEYVMIGFIFLFLLKIIILP